jgi:hypothetical protein
VFGFTIRTSEKSGAIPHLHHYQYCGNLFSDTSVRVSRQYLFFPRPFAPDQKTEQAGCWNIHFSVCEKVAASSQLVLPLSISPSGALPRHEEKQLTLRLMEIRDIPQIADMCCDEYGGRPRFPSKLSLAALFSYLDALTLRPLVESTLRLKVKDDVIPSNTFIPEDHAVLVLTCGATVVATIEVSRQPIVPNRNPSAYPLPLWYKQLLGTLSMPSLSFSDEKYKLQGWITNLLVRPNYRNRGCAKLLVTACETVAAQHWNCSSIHLHCDANGRIAQRLYQKSMGYGTVLSNNAMTMSAVKSKERASGDDFDDKGTQMAKTNSMHSTFQPPGVFMVEGVPLLFLQKSLLTVNASSTAETR